jgi:drug/metabolite transporter (DMT)-like permease
VALGAITLGPQLIGHIVLNWVLRYVESSVISGIVLAELVVSVLLAWLVLSEKPRLLPYLAARSCWPGCTSCSRVAASRQSQSRSGRAGSHGAARGMLYS